MNITSRCTPPKFWLAMCAVGLLGIAVGFGTAGWLLPVPREVPAPPVVEAPVPEPPPKQVVANQEAPIPPAADLGAWTATIQGRCSVSYTPALPEVEPGRCELVRGCAIAVCEPEKVPYTFGMGKELVRVEVDQGEYRLTLPAGRYAVRAVMGHRWTFPHRCRFLAGTGSAREYRDAVELTAGSVVQLDFEIAIPLP